MQRIQRRAVGVTHLLGPGNGHLQILEQAIVQTVEPAVNDQLLSAGDALTLADEPLLQIDHGQGAEVLVFDLAPS